MIKIFCCFCNIQQTRRVYHRLSFENDVLNIPSTKEPFVWFCKRPAYGYEGDDNTVDVALASDLRIRNCYSTLDNYEERSISIFNFYKVITSSSDCSIVFGKSQKPIIASPPFVDDSFFIAIFTKSQVRNEKLLKEILYRLWFIDVYILFNCWFILCFYFWICIGVIWNQVVLSGVKTRKNWIWNLNMIFQLNLYFVVIVPILPML